MTGVLITGLLAAVVIIWQGVRRIGERSGVIFLACGLWLVWSNLAVSRTEWTPTSALVAAAVALVIAGGVHVAVVRLDRKR